MTENDPLELIEQHSLPVAFRGYDRKTTDGLFDQLKTTLATVESERAVAHARVGELESRLKAVQEREKEITEALLLASRVRGESEREGKELKAKYEREAEALGAASKQAADERLRAAAAEADKILGEARSRAREFQQEARDAEQIAVRARGQLIAFLESVLAEIERRGTDLGSALQEIVERDGAAGRSGGVRLATLPTSQSSPEERKPEE
jgi:cell division septum initiation protein DivIVA